MIMKRLLFKLLAGLFLLFLPICAMGRECVVLDANTRQTTLPVMSTSIQSVGTENVKNFCVDAPEDGQYFCSFWLLSADYGNSVYSTFKVRVNGTYVGIVTTKQGGWQSAQIDDASVVYLKKGNNVVSIASEGCEIPEVETLYLARKYYDTTFDGSKYEEYVENAMDGYASSYEVCPDNTTVTYDLTLNTYLLKTTLPLRYSFFKMYNLKQGDHITVSATSLNKKHVIDVFYVGDLLGDNETFDKPGYIEATTDEMQGLAWRRDCDPQMTDGSHYVSTMSIDIPKSGLYMFKLRTSDNNAITTASFSATGSRSHGFLSELLNLGKFQNVPISYGCADCVIPANAKDYYVYTQVHGDQSDPMLFVEGNDGGRIVGFNNGVDDDLEKEYGIGSKDALIAQTYKVKTSGVHVANYSSLSPDISCGVFCKLANLILPAKMPLRQCMKSEKTDNVYGIDAILDVVGVNSYEVFSASGEKILTCNGGEDVLKKAKFKSGMYVVKVNRPDGKFDIYKFFVK